MRVKPVSVTVKLKVEFPETAKKHLDRHVDENRFALCPRSFEQSPQQCRTNEWHVTGKEKHRVRFGFLEGSVGSTQRPARWHKVFANHAGRQTQLRGGLLNSTEERK